MLTEENIALVRRVVHRTLPQSCDRESIVQDIICEAIAKKLPRVNTIHVRRRCIDVIRRVKREARALERFCRAQTMTTEFLSTLVNEDMINHLTAVLTVKERKVIWYRFYRDLTIEEVSKVTELPREQVSTHLREALYKMSQVV